MKPRGVSGFVLQNPLYSLSAVCNFLHVKGGFFVTHLHDRVRKRTAAVVWLQMHSPANTGKPTSAASWWMGVREGLAPRGCGAAGSSLVTSPVCGRRPVVPI